MSNLNRRNVPRISYAEFDETDLDEYIFCTECGDYVFEYCAIHGPMLVIPDDKVQKPTKFPACVPRAALTIPHVFLHIAPSEIPGAGLGVFATLTLPKDVRFGPYCGKITHEVTSDFCWQILSTKRKESHVIDAGDPNKSNWMRYVNCSRHTSEQNLVAFQYRGQMYYRTIKIIPRNTELLIFYGSEFVNKLGIDLSLYNMPIEYCIRKRELQRANAIAQEAHTSSLRTDKKTEKPDIPNFVPQDCPENTNENTNNLNDSSPASTLTNSRNRKKSYKCRECSHKSSTQTGIQRHSLLHDPNRKYICNICGYRYTDNYSLYRHTKTHALENNQEYTGTMVPCKLCTKKCKTKEHLKLHLLKIHLGVKPHKCKYCDFKTSVLYSLKRHVAMHNNNKKFKCELCSYGYDRVNDLTIHNNKYHKNVYTT